MSLVEKIVRNGRSETGAVETGRGPGGDRPATPVDIEERGFELDIPTLRREGYVGGARRNGAIAMELGEIRRRLMREVDLFNEREKRSRACRILVTSAHPGEGKTFTALNLAMSTVFQEGAPAVLFDADLVRCELGKRFGLPVERNDRPVLYQAEDVPLGVVPAFVSRAQVKSPDGRRRTIEVMSALAKQRSNALLVIDSPPLHAMSDAAFLAPYVDHVVLVVGAGMTSSDDVARSIDILGADDRVSLLLNRVRFNTDRANSYAYGYDYHAYQ
jgi:Mrp family chromosome partitioning ATPase